MLTMCDFMKTDFSKFPSIGGSNSYSMPCEELRINESAARVSYSVCQHTILAFKEKRLPTGSFTDCATAIRTGKCQAVKMMLEEVKSGERIYYINGLEEMRKVREEIERLSAKSTERRKRDASFGTRLLPKTDTKKPAVLVDIYAEAVNAEVKKTKENT